MRAIVHGAPLLERLLARLRRPQITVLVICPTCYAADESDLTDHPACVEWVLDRLTREVVKGLQLPEKNEGKTER